MSDLPIETRFLDVRGLRIAIHTLGDPNAPPVLALHGFMDHGLSFKAVAEALSGRLRLIAPDFRGHGHSGWVGAGNSYHFFDYYSDLLAVIEFMGLTELRIVGHSMGGSATVGLGALLEKRVTSIVLLEGMGPPGEDAETAPDRLLRFAMALTRDWASGDPAARASGRRPMPTVADAAERMRSLNPRLSMEMATRLADDATELVPGGRVWRYDPLHRTPSSRPFRSDEFQAFLGRITAPVLSLMGAESEFILPDLESRHQTLRSARVGRVLGAGHNIHHDQPMVVAEALAHWFLGDRAQTLPSGISEVSLKDPFPRK